LLWALYGSRLKAGTTLKISNSRHYRGPGLRAGIHKCESFRNARAMVMGILIRIELRIFYECDLSGLL
jgi:hypothetical protein